MWICYCVKRNNLLSVATTSGEVAGVVDGSCVMIGDMEEEVRVDADVDEFSSV